jgi:hypothetical protein
MKEFGIFVSLLISIHGYCQKKDTITQKGWLIYRYGDLLAFLPLANQSKTPTYKNFLTEEKGDGQRMNNNYDAPSKLLNAKKIALTTYKYEGKSDKYTVLGRRKFYVQPVKYTYEFDAKDTADDLAGGWYFRVNGKPQYHYVYYFMFRSGIVSFLNRSDSLLAERGGRRKNIKIYPPH